MAFSYYSQLVDPSSPANVIRRPQHTTSNAPYSSNYYNPSANRNAGAASGYYAPHLGYTDPSQNTSRETFVPPAGPPPGWKDADDGVDGHDKVPAYDAAGYGIGVGEGDAKTFRSDSASERTVVGRTEESGKDVTEEDPFSDYKMQRQEARLQEHGTGRSAQGPGRF